MVIDNYCQLWRFWGASKWKEKVKKKIKKRWKKRLKKFFYPFYRQRQWTSFDWSSRNLFHSRFLCWCCQQRLFNSYSSWLCWEEMWIFGGQTTFLQLWSLSSHWSIGQDLLFGWIIIFFLPWKRKKMWKHFFYFRQLFYLEWIVI